MRRFPVLVALAILLTACADKAHTSAETTTSCHDVIPQCNVDRLPDKVLTGDETDGALHSTDGFDLSGIISFDDALKLGWHESPRSDATSVQVVLGSADADKLHWGTGTNLYYAVEWNGVCETPIGPSPTDNAPPPSPQCGLTWSSAFDARTGAFIVEGT